MTNETTAAAMQAEAEFDSSEYDIEFITEESDDYGDEILGSTPADDTRGEPNNVTDLPRRSSEAQPGGGVEEDEPLDPVSALADEEGESEGPGRGDEETIVELESGEKIPLRELEKGYLRQADYTRKTQNVAVMRSQMEQAQTSVQTQQRQVQNAWNGLHKYIQGILPPEPDPSMISTDPQGYQQQLAYRAQAQHELNAIMKNAKKVKGQAKQLQGEQLTAAVTSERHSLLDKMPELNSPKRMQVFMDNYRQTAQNLGFNEQEIGMTYDHRILQMAYLAGVGMRALRNQKSLSSNVGRRPTKVSSTGRGQRGRPSNRDAMGRFRKTGSLEDAVHIDFD